MVLNWVEVCMSLKEINETIFVSDTRYVVEEYWKG
jgi:hypothetical protein